MKNKLFLRLVNDYRVVVVKLENKICSSAFASKRLQLLNVFIIFCFSKIRERILQLY